MTSQQITTVPPARGAAMRRRAAGLAAFAALATAGCNIDETLTIPDPDVATPGSVQGRAGLDAVRRGAIGDFSLALAGSGGTEDGFIQYSALFTDEFQWAETFPTREQIDRRSIEPVNGTMLGVFLNAQRARASAERAAANYAEFGPTEPGYAESLSFAGFSYVYLAEHYCSGVPFSSLTADGKEEYGMPQTTTEMFTTAVARFDSALKVLGATATPAANTQRSLARVGRARALLNLNRLADAKTTAAGVPATFAYQLQFSENTGRQNNGVHVVVQLGRRFTASANEGGNGLPYRLDNDPRVQAPRGTGGAALGFDGATPLFVQQKYPTRSAPIALATGTEARLIEAEADLRAGSAVTAFATLNALRGTSTPALAALTPAATPAGQVDQLFKERAYWLWLTGHRTGDLRRLVRQYSRPAESVFPSGTYFKGGNYGTDVNWPLPTQEANNPNYRECIDRNA